jgi:hypothetical protein
MMILGERKIASMHEYTSAFSKVKQEQEKKGIVKYQVI